MVKRLRDEDSDIGPPAKILRTYKPDRLSSLSDELLLRTLSFLPLRGLVQCQRLSKRLKYLAGDSQLWKALYYERFVRPRASRIPGVQGLEESTQSLYYASRISKWLGDEHLVKRGTATNWKRQYKLRHNWSRGSARISETKVAEMPPTPPLLLRLHDNIVITADARVGLKAWSLGGKGDSLASIELCSKAPTALAVDVQGSSKAQIHISVGFENGSFAIYTLLKNDGTFILQHRHPQSANGSIQALAFASPYLLTMAGASLLSLYRFPGNRDVRAEDQPAFPLLLSSLRSQIAYAPVQLTIRISASGIIASIAYAMPTWALGWSVGLQELRLTDDGTTVDSRVASANSRKSFAPPISDAHMQINGPRIPLITKPTSLSYNHPYLLSAHADNTLTLYLVTSHADELRIGAPERLWGHTTSVSGAHIGDRGRAVSVSSIGDEIRVWELEGGPSSRSSQKRTAGREASVQVRSEKKHRGSLTPQRAIYQELSERRDEKIISKGWVAFDEEKLVLLREKIQGTQAVVVYDFS